MLLFFILLAIITMILISYIKINIINLELSSDREKKLNLKSTISIYLFNRIKIFSYKINESQIKKVNFQKNTIGIKYAKKQLKILKPNLEKINLKVEIGTEDILLTTSLVTTISTFISIFLSNAVKKYKKEDYNYQVSPIYSQNIIKVDGSCIISLKLVHIMDIIYIFLRKGRKKKNERTSNRRTNDGCYE